MLKDDNLTKYNCNLSEKLYKSNLIYEKKFLDKWIIFAPDKEGFPIIINEETHNLINLFKKGETINNVIINFLNITNKNIDVGKILSKISLLQEKGFLTKENNTLPYKLVKKRRKSSSIGIWLHLTNECNLNCSYCFVKDHSKKVMDIKTFEWISKALIKTTNKYNINQIHLKFAGGEPTLKLDLMEQFHNLIIWLNKSDDIRIFTSVLSNGINLNKRLLNFLKRQDCGIGISIDGYKDKHNIYRRFRSKNKGSWDKIEKNIFILKDNGIIPYIMTTLSKETVDSLSDLLQWINENGLKTRLSIVRETNCSWQNIDNLKKEYENLCEIMIKEFDKALNQLESSSIKIDLINGVEICELHFDKPADAVICGIGKNHLVIKPNGNIVSCPMLIDEKGIKPQEDLLLSCKKTFPYSPYKRYYDNIEDDCLSCLWYPVCAGECPIINKLINKHPFTKSPMCEFYKFIIPRYIEFFGKKLIQSEQKIIE